MTLTPSARISSPTFERAALVMATGLTALSLTAAPSWRTEALEICHLAGIAAAVIVAGLWITRSVGPRAMPIEPYGAAAFLAGMPVVYVLGWLEAKEARTSGLALELIGLPVYVGLAALGLKRSPWFLVVGIAAHGIAWDAGHLLVRTAYIPTWYAAGCLIVDLGLSLYFAARIPAWRRAQESQVRIRDFRDADADGLDHLFRDTVRRVNRRDYSATQVDAWASVPFDGAAWRLRLLDGRTFVAESTAGAALGFLTLNPDGHIDLLYCQAENQGRGIATRLLAAAERQARDWNRDRLWVEASVTAHPFFTKRGFRTLEEQTVWKNGACFTNFRMERRLA